MELKTTDIVLIKSLKKKGMIIDTALDLETNKKKYFINVGDEENYICSEEDLEYVTCLEEEYNQSVFNVPGNIMA